MAYETLLDIAKRIRAISDKGLLYSTGGYEKERYTELLAISEKLMSDALQAPVEMVQRSFEPCVDYPTPKVDVRAMVLNSRGQILMVQEKADNCWSLPGGWADIGQTPSEVAVNEVQEETGLDVRCTFLAAVFDKRMHPHPPEPYYVYKMIFCCELTGDENTALTPAFDVLDAGWFSVDELPPLSKNRILESQVKTVFQNIRQQHFITIFD